jgi:sensor histidine kinase YesM
MWLNMFTLASEVITNDGGISADYTLTIIVGACGVLITALLTFVFNSLNKNIQTLSEGFTKFQQDFHEFVKTQSVINERFEQRTKDL